MGQNRNGISGGMGCLLVIAAMLVIGRCGADDREGPPPAPTPAQELLDDKVVAQCRKVLAEAQRIKMIRQRPEPHRINVDELAWALLPADDKDRIMQAVSCDVWGTAMPMGYDSVVAYGWRSGKRIQQLTAYGMDRE